MNESKYNGKETSRDENDIYLVRKGICEYLAEGDIPRQGAVRSEDAHYAQEREVTEATEIALQEKALTIIDTLKYDPQNHKAWYRLGFFV